MLIDNQLNRTTVPEIRMVDRIKLEDAEREQFNPNVDAFLTPGGQKNLIKVIMVIPAGRRSEPQKLVAQIAARMLKEGTEKYTAKEIAEKFDYYGASVSTAAGMDQATISIFVLKKFLAPVMELVVDVLNNASFPNKEFQTVIKNSLQKLAVNLEKTSYLASTRFYEHLFGADHPYGYEVQVEDYENLNPGMLKSFHRDQYHSSGITAYIAGKYDAADIDLLKQAFAEIKTGPNREAGAVVEPVYLPKQIKVVKEDAVQAALRIGSPSIEKTHPDRKVLTILNTIFGGYFGSRLMSNIREEKGYTYGIYSSIESLRQQSYFLISTEVGAEVADDAVNEIFKEMSRLQTELIPEAELDLVKNYMLGSLLQQFDGPFRISRALKNLNESGLNAQYIHDLVEVVKHVSPADIQSCAQKYFNRENQTVVIASNR